MTIINQNRITNVNQNGTTINNGRKITIKQYQTLYIEDTTHRGSYPKKIPCYQKLFISREGNYKKQTKNLLKIHKEGLSRDKTVLPLVTQRLLRKKNLLAAETISLRISTEKDKVQAINDKS